MIKQMWEDGDVWESGLRDVQKYFIVFFQLVYKSKIVMKYYAKI